MYEYNCEVKRVVDGDTVDVVIDLGFDIHYSSRVRLYGIDTPESRTRLALDITATIEKKFGVHLPLPREHGLRPTARVQHPPHPSHPHPFPRSETMLF